MHLINFIICQVSHRINFSIHSSLGLSVALVFIVSCIIILSSATDSNPANYSLGLTVVVLAFVSSFQSLHFGTASNTGFLSSHAA